MKLHIENSIVIEMNGKTAALGCGEYEFDSASEFIKFIESLGEEPKQPLIKDEKIRKAVRAWAEATGTTSISYWGGEVESEQNDSKIEFDDIAVVDFGDNYTIAELCGEEEE